MKKKSMTRSFFVICIVSFFMGGCSPIFDLPDSQLRDRKLPWGTDTEKEGEIESCSSMEELTQCIEKNLFAQKETVTVRLKGIEKKDLLMINEYVNPCWGTCTKYKQRGSIAKEGLFEIELKINDETYVYNAICNDGDINQAPESAQTLYRKVKQVLKKEIKASMSDYQKELAFYKYLIANCTYNRAHADSCHCDSQNDQTADKTDVSHTAYGALVDGTPVCSGYARALHLLLACEGINAKIIAGRGADESHCWNLVQLDDKWYQLDVTWDDMDKTKKNYFYYFNITDEMMSGSHTWDRERYPAATGKKYNYYRLKKKYFTSREKFKKDMYQTMIQSGKKSYTALLDGFQVRDKDMEILFRNNQKYSSVRWNILRDSKYSVIKVRGK